MTRTGHVLGVTVDTASRRLILRRQQTLRTPQRVAQYATTQAGPTCEGDDRVPDLYVDGSWVSALAGGRRTIVCPADGQVVGEVDEAGPEDTAFAIDAAHRAFNEGPWPTHVGPRARRPPAPHRRPARAGRRRGRRGRVDGHRQAAGRERVRRRRRGLRVPPLRPHGGRGLRPHRRHRQPRRGQPGRPRAARRLRADRPLELPAAPGQLEGRALPGRRQHVRAQAERADAAHEHPSDAAARGGRAAGRRRQPGARCRTRGGRAARGGHPGRPGLLHRRAADRPAHHGGGRGNREEGRPRAGRQEPQHRLRRRRPRGRARLRADRRLPPLRPGLLGRRPAAGAGGDPRRLRRRARRPGRHHPAGRAARREGRDRAADQRRAPRQGGGVRRRRARRGGRAPLRWCGTGRPRARERLLLPADRARRLHQCDVGDPGRSRSARS